MNPNHSTTLSCPWCQVVPSRSMGTLWKVFESAAVNAYGITGSTPPP
jgi:hypothetical protein